ncbi:unnamed protein product [Amoebophrya sp. A120]|nr:unnamed protein product [Amoebophrya sp. A120]|eukprot:GSA120T00007116001.1
MATNSYAFLVSSLPQAAAAAPGVTGTGGSSRGDAKGTPPDAPLLAEAVASFLAGDPGELRPGSAEASTPLRAVNRSWLGAADKARAAASGSRSKEEDLARRRDARRARDTVTGLLQAIKDDTVIPSSTDGDSFAHDWKYVARMLAARKSRADAFNNINTPEPAGNGIRNNIHARQSFFLQIFEAFVAQNVDQHGSSSRSPEVPVARDPTPDGGPVQGIFPTELLISLEDAIGRICTAPDLGRICFPTSAGWGSMDDSSISDLTYYTIWPLAREVVTQVKIVVCTPARPPRERPGAVTIAVIQGRNDPPLEIPGPGLAQNQLSMTHPLSRRNGVGMRVEAEPARTVGPAGGPAGEVQKYNHFRAVRLHFYKKP